MEKIHDYCFDHGKYIIEYDDFGQEEFFCNKNYFKMMDNFYRYGIGFPKEIIHKNKLLVQNVVKNHYRFINIYEDKYNLHRDPKIIYIDDIDNGEKELTEIE